MVSSLDASGLPGELWGKKSKTKQGSVPAPETAIELFWRETKQILKACQGTLVSIQG